jgi:hypothetical protein
VSEELTLEEMGLVYGAREWDGGRWRIAIPKA